MAINFNDDDGREATVANAWEMMTEYANMTSPKERLKRPPTPPKPKYEAHITFAEDMRYCGKQAMGRTILALQHILGLTAERAACIMTNYIADIESHPRYEGLPQLILAVNVNQVGALHAQHTRREKWVGQLMLTELRPLSMILDVSGKRGASF